MKMKKLPVLLICVFVLTLGLSAGEKKAAESKPYWMPNYPEVTAKFINQLREKVKEEKHVKEVCEAIPKMCPEMKDFKKLIYNDPVLRMYFTQMIDQVPAYYKLKGPRGYLQSVCEMLVLMDYILTTAPEFNDTDLVGFPINMLLDWTMGVPAGFTAYRNGKVNKMFRKILNKWKKYLDSEESLYVLNDSPTGWKSKAAIEALKMWEFQYKPKEKYWGFKSWNKFFIRKFKKGMRPMDGKGKKNIIVSACESTVVQIAKDVKKTDWFWVKAQPYSLYDMLAKDKKNKNITIKEHFKKFVKPFIGGVVYQAFLSAKKYHRWHSPVSGEIVAAYVVPGTYYSDAESQGMDPAGPDLSQGYIAHVATRALIYIKAEEPVGLMCFMPIGMGEVSSCFIHQHIKPGHKVVKGEELGYFQYGGSSHCLIFKPGVIKEFRRKDGTPLKIDDDVKVKEMIAITN